MKIVFNSKAIFNSNIVGKSVLLFLCVLLFTSQLYAQQKFSLTAKVGQQVTLAFDFYELGKSAQALTQLNKISPRSAFDKAYINRFKGNLYWQAGNEKRAVKALQVAIAEHALEPQQHYQTVRMLADLYLNLKQTEDAIELYNRLIAQLPSEELYKHLAMAYYQQKSWAKLVDASRNAIRLSSTFNQSVHILQLSGLYELQDYKNASGILVKLTEMDTQTKRWWMQLISTYQLLNQSKKALATYELAYQKGFLVSESEIKQLASFRASLGAPYQAALLLESAIDNQKVSINAKNYQMLARFWQVAREHNKAQQYWGKSADLSGNARHYLAQAQLLQLLGRYDDMLTVLAQAESDNRGLQSKVELTKIQALFALKKYQQAFHIASALMTDPQSKEHALRWVKLLESLS